MFIPSRVIGWFESFQKSAEKNAEVAKEAMQQLREELSAVRAERDLLKTELLSAKINSDWLRVKVNDLEFQNKGLIEKAYQIKLPVPEIVATPAVHNPFKSFDSFSPFEDMGDEMAAKLGLPTYNK